MSGVYTMNLNIYRSPFLITNNKRENIYCDGNGRIFSFLNNPQQESLLWVFMTLNHSFLNLKNIAPIGRVPPRIMW